MTEEEFSQEVSAASQDLRNFVTKGKSLALEVAVRLFGRMDEATKPLQEGVACRRGCSYCCYYHVYITAQEAFVLAEHIEKLEPSSRTKVDHRIRENCDAVKGLSVEQHIRTNIRCAFLGDAGECIAYEVRPGACRAHHAMDVTACKVTFEDTQSPLENQMRADLKMTSNAYILAHEMAHETLGLDNLRYELNGAVMEARLNPASFRRYKDGKKSFPTVRDFAEPNFRNQSFEEFEAITFSSFG